MTCEHEVAEVNRSAVVILDDGSKVLRTYCTDCGQFVEGAPALDRCGHVVVDAWVPIGSLYEEEP